MSGRVGDLSPRQAEALGKVRSSNSPCSSPISSAPPGGRGGC
uniref:Uncharacterized protein n=1 Tax=Chelonoidis abingdonii TaxID=106734 RepID=A0A8C0FZB2_CHEAB